jgi:ferritin-like metal-binding protein YciE
MVEAANSSELRNVFSQDLAETKSQIERLAQIFQGMGQEAKGKTCHGMKGILEEGGNTAKEDAEPEVRDAGLIAAAQRAKHYEIAVYGTLRTWARRLGEDSAAQLFQKILDEEKEEDKRLTQIAEGSVNIEAAKKEMTGSKAV